MNATDTYTFKPGTRIVATVPFSADKKGTVVADDGRCRVLRSDRQPQVAVHFDGHTGPVPFNVSQLRRA